MPTDEKPSRNEEEYSAKLNAELIREQRARLDAERASRDTAQPTMKCPRCGGTLTEREYHHIKVDACDTCGGMWFDKGEVEMLEHVEQGALDRFARSLFGLRR